MTTKDRDSTPEPCHGDLLLELANEAPLTKAIREAAAIYEQMHVIKFAIGRLRELTDDDYPLTIRIEANNVQECVDLLRYKLHELRTARSRAALLAKRSSDEEQQPYLVSLIQSEEMA